MKTSYIIIIAIIILALGGLFFLARPQVLHEPQPEFTETQLELDTATESASTQDPVTLEPAPIHTNIKLDSPRHGDRISSPLTITGEAKGSWFFEATFPIVLTDWNGLIISEGFATTSTEDWMTEEFIPFEAQLEFEKPELYDRGSLILQKNNPSDKRELDDAYEITIFFE